MAVPEPAERSKLCERCFALVGPNDAACPECGAPIDNGGNRVPDEDAVQPDLARANLLRMRGEYKQAEEVCLSILRRFPNQPTANGLLGDICAERGDLEQAAEWYELTLDLTPKDTVIERKLADVRERMAHRDVAATAKKLGLPTSKPRMGLFAIGLLIVLVGSAVVAYTLGRQAKPAAQGSDLPVVTDLPVTLSGDSRTTAGGATVGAAEDQAIVRKLLEAAPQESAKLLDAEIDPRTGVITLTFRVSEGEDPRTLGARLAAFTLQSEPRSPRVVLRAVRSSALVWVADVERDDFEATMTTEWRQSHGDDTAAWLNAVLSREWPFAPTFGRPSPESEVSSPSVPSQPRSGDMGDGLTTPPDQGQPQTGLETAPSPPASPQSGSEVNPWGAGTY